MMNNTSYAWKQQLLTALDEQQVSSAVNDNDADWEYIDSEMIKFGSLSHGQLDIKKRSSVAVYTYLKRRLKIFGS